MQYPHFPSILYSYCDCLSVCLSVTIVMSSRQLTGQCHIRLMRTSNADHDLCPEYLDLKLAT